MSLPTYRIEAPDIVRLDVMRLIPRPSYRIDAYDVLQIRGYGVLLQQPIDDYFLVEAGGIVTLGPAYGVVRVEGMTTEEASAAITQMLRTFLPYAQATVRLARSANAQDISREYIVGPDGVINISRFGAVRLIGLTVTEARLAIQERLAPYFDRPVVGVEVVGFNSKFYYVITAEAALLGESVLRFPVTGNETVLDAIGQLSQTPGMHKVSSKTMWVARPVPDSCNEEQICHPLGRHRPRRRDDNQLPTPAADRLYIVNDNLVAMNNYVNIVTSPIAKLLGVTSLGRQHDKKLANPRPQLQPVSQNLMIASVDRRRLFKSFFERT